MGIGPDIDNRLELFKVLADRTRLQLLVLAAEEELAIGELAELMEESQPNLSRQVAPLRKLGVLAERRQGTRVLVRLADGAACDPVIADALALGRQLCESNGVLSKIAPLIERRDAPSREFFARPRDPQESLAFPAELPAYLAAVAPLLVEHRLAIDVGTGDGSLLEVLAPLFERVVAIDREPAQLDHARARLEARGYANVQFEVADLLDDAVDPGVLPVGQADAVFASRLLHHAPRPALAVARLAALARPGGTVTVLDYLAHDDEGMRKDQADLWLGFSRDELRRFCSEGGLTAPRLQDIPRSFHSAGPDRHLSWCLLTARRA
ncbi:MAG: metalloregulator ArsR/SmtB family transcription factor [Myxococcales bacterium]|nr:metalloregulator ArsR/SmtB family transcription factor [Myxococcales bacterium]